MLSEAQQRQIIRSNGSIADAFQSVADQLPPRIRRDCSSPSVILCLFFREVAAVVFNRVFLGPREGYGATADSGAQWNRTI